MSELRVCMAPLIDPNGNPIMERESIYKLVCKEPNRITYKPAVMSKPNFKKVLLDNEYTGYVRCFLCTDRVHVQKAGSSGSGNMLNHNHRSHPELQETCSVKYEKQSFLTAKNREDVNKMLDKAARALDGHLEADRYMFYFVETGNAGVRMKPEYECCYCDYKCMWHARNMRGHLIYNCPGAPDDVKEEVSLSSRARNTLDEERDEGVDIDGTFNNDGGVETNKDAVPDGDDDNAIQILNQILDTSGWIETQKKELKLQQLRNQIKEVEMRIKKEKIKIQNEEMAIKETEIGIKENDEKRKFYLNLNQQIDKLIGAGEFIMNRYTRHGNNSLNFFHH